MDYLQYNNPQLPLDEKFLNYDIMLMLDDATLINLCATDSAIRTVCLDDNFWRLKLEIMLGRSIPYESIPDHSWRSIYQQGSRYPREPNQWIYVLVVRDPSQLTTQVFNDASVAYNSLLSKLAVAIGVSVQQLLTMDLGTLDLRQTTYSIYVIKLGESATHLQQKSQIFYLRQGYQANFNMAINYYPALTVPALLIQYQDGIMFDLLTAQILSRLFGGALYLTIHNTNNNTSAKFYRTKIGFIERWVLPTPLLITNEIIGQTGWVLVVLDPVNILPTPPLDPTFRPTRRLQRQFQPRTLGTYQPQDIIQLLVNSRLATLEQLINYF